MQASGAAQSKELTDVSPLRADADILQEKLHLAPEILISGGAATVINTVNQKHFDVQTPRALIKMALNGVKGEKCCIRGGLRSPPCRNVNYTNASGWWGFKCVLHSNSLCMSPQNKVVHCGHDCTPVGSWQKILKVPVLLTAAQHFIIWQNIADWDGEVA